MIMAESTHSTKESVKSESSGGSFFSGSGGAAFFPEGLIQRKCATCKEEEEKKIQRQESSPDAGTPAAPAAGTPPAAPPTPAAAAPDVITGADPAAASAAPTLPSLFGPPGSASTPSLWSTPLIPGLPGLGGTPSLDTPNYALTPPGGAPGASTGQPDWFGLTSPYALRGAGQVTGGDMDAMQSLWQQNYSLGGRLMTQWPDSMPFRKSLPDFRTWFANTTTGAAVDNSLKGDYPTPVEQSNNQSGISQHVIPGPALHFKLEVNRPNDPYEQEADAMADKVIQRQSAEVRLQGDGIHTKCAHCEEEEKEKKIQRKDSEETESGVTVSKGLEQTLNASTGKGNPLPAPVNEEMSKAFGADFSGVSIHSDGQSSQMNRSLNAHAFTHGSDIYFNAGKFDPGSESGKHLLAHELTHVVQQGAVVSRKVQSDSNTGAIQRKVSVGAQCNSNEVTGLVSDALTWLDDINLQLGGYISNAAQAGGATPGGVPPPQNPGNQADQQRIGAALQQAFNTSDAAYAGVIQARFQHIAAVVRDNGVVSVDCGGAYCTGSAGGATVAYSDRPYHLVMCGTVSSTPSTVASLIHELSHAVLPQVGINNTLTAVGQGVRDRSYVTDRIFSHLTPEETLDNAASYETLATLLHNRANTTIVQPQKDTTSSCNQTQGPLVLEAFARADQWNSAALHELKTEEDYLKTQGSQKLSDLPQGNLDLLKKAFPSVTDYAHLDQLRAAMDRLSFNGFGGTPWNFACTAGNGGHAGAVGFSYAGWVTSSSATLTTLRANDMNVTPDWFALSHDDKVKTIYALHLISRPSWIVAGIPLPQVFDFVNGTYAIVQANQPTPTTTGPQDHVKADRPFVRPKLEVNQPDDPFERAADAMADKVVQRADKVVQRPPAESIQRDTAPQTTKTANVNQSVVETISNAPAADNRWNGRYTIHSKFQVVYDLASRKVTVVVKLYSTASAALKASWKSAIESKWGKGQFQMEVWRTCPYDSLPIYVDIQWVTRASDADYTIHAQAPGATSGGRAGLGGTSSMTDWGTADTVDITHEFGHMLGNPEEYFTTNGIDYTRGGTKSGMRDTGGGIMNNPSEAPMPKHFDSVRISFGNLMHFPLDLIRVVPTGASLTPMINCDDNQSQQKGVIQTKRSEQADRVQLQCADCAMEEKEKKIQRDEAPKEQDDEKLYPAPSASIDAVGADYAHIRDTLKKGPDFPGMYLVVANGALTLYSKSKAKVHSYPLARALAEAIKGYWEGDPYTEHGWYPILKSSKGNIRILAFSKEAVEKEIAEKTKVGILIEALDEEMDPISWLRQEDQDKFKEDVPGGTLIGMAIVNVSAGGGGGGGQEGPHYNFTLPAWFADLKKKLDQKVSDDKKAHPDDHLLPASLLYYGSDKAQAERGADAWTIEIKAMLGNEAKKAFLTLAKGDWDGATDKDEYVKGLEQQIRDKVSHLNENLQTGAFEKKEGQSDKDEAAKGSRFAWAIILKNAIFQKLTELKAKDNTLTDIPDKLTLVSEGDEQSGQAYLKVWIQQESTEEGKKGQKELLGATMAVPVVENSTVSDWVPLVRAATDQLRKGGPPKDAKAIEFKDAHAGSSEEDIKPPYPAYIRPLDLSPDFNTVPSASNHFRFVLDIASAEGNNMLNLVTINMGMVVYHYWSVYPMPEDLKAFKAAPGTKASDLITESNKYVADNKKDLGKRLEHDGPDRDWDEKVPMDRFLYGDYLLVGQGQPVYNDEKFKRAGSVAAYPFTVAQPATLGKAKTEAESNELKALKDQLEKDKDKKEKEEENKALADRISNLEKRQTMDLTQLSQNDIDDTDKMIGFAQKLKAFIVDDRQQHISYAGNATTDPFSIRLSRLNPILANIYDMIHKQYDPAKYDDLTAVDMYIEGLNKQKGELTGLKKRAGAASSAFKPNTKTYRTIVTMVDDKTGVATPILMQMGESIHEKDGTRQYTLVDVSSETAHKGDMIYVGEEDTTDKNAVHNAFVKFGKDNHYCTGKIEYRVPGLDISGEADSIVPWYRIVEGAVAAAGLVALAAGVVASGGLLAPGAAAVVGGVATVLGVSSAVVGAGLAIGHMYERREKGTLGADAETGMDIINILAAFTIVGGLVLKSTALAGRFATVAAAAKLMKTAQAKNLILIYDGADLAANGILMGVKVKEDVAAINALDIPQDQKDRMLDDVAREAIQQGAMLAIASAGKMGEIVEHFQGKRESSPILSLEERVESSPYQSLKEKGYITEEGKISDNAPPYLHEKTPQNEGLRAAELGEANRKEASIMGMASGDTVDGAHKITVTENGKIIRCSDLCQELRAKYMELLEQEMAGEGKKNLNKRLDKIEEKAKKAADTNNDALASEAKAEAIALEGDLAQGHLNASVEKTPFDLTTLPEAFKNEPIARQMIVQMRQGGMSVEEVSAILQNAAKHGVGSPKKFLADLGMTMSMRKNAKGISIKNTGKLIEGLKSGNKATFETASELVVMSNVSNQKASNPWVKDYPGMVTVDGILDIFSLDELRSLTTRELDNTFVTGIYSISKKIPGAGKAEILELMNAAAKNAGKGEEGWARLVNILDDERVEVFTTEQVRTTIEKYDSWQTNASATLADKEHGFSKTVGKLWGENTKATDKDSPFQVATQARKGTDAYGEELYALTTGETAKLRVDPIINGVVGSGGKIDEAKWFVVHQAVMKADVPDIAKSGILGELWTRVNVESIKSRTGIEPMREVRVHGVDNKVDARMDIAYLEGTTLKFIECKARLGELSNNQERVYPIFATDTNRNKLTFTDPTIQALYSDGKITIAYERANEIDIMPK